MNYTTPYPQAWIDPKAAVVPMLSKSTRMIRPPNILPIFIEGQPIAYQLYEKWGVDTPWGRIECPLGMICDGASVPRFLWGKFPPDGLIRASALAHDRGCSLGGKFEDFTLTFEENNAMMKWIMERSRMDPGDINLVYRGVSSFIGRRAFHESARRGPRVEPLYYEIS